MHGQGLVELVQGATFVGNFCSNNDDNLALLQGKGTYKGTIDRIKENELLPYCPIESEVLKLICEAKGNFTDGVANGDFELKFREGSAFAQYKGRLVDGMFAGIGSAEIKKSIWVPVKWNAEKNGIVMV